MRVLHVCETARGGVATYIDTLLKLCRPADSQQVVLPEEHRFMLAEAAACRTFRYPQRSMGSLMRMLWIALVARFRFRPDIIFCHSSLALCALAILRPISHGIAFVYCPHGWAGIREGGGPFASRMVRWVEGWLCGLADAVVNVSQADLDHARRNNYSGNHVLIENAVLPIQTGATDVEPPIAEDPEVINLLFVGRHDPQKGLDVLLGAFAKARAKRTDIRLFVIGEAVVSNVAAIGAHGAQMGDGITWLGWVGRDRIDACYKAADLVVMPSRWEGLPLVIPESLRNGTPVLVSDRSGLPGLIIPGATGYVSRLDGDSFGDLIAGLERAELVAMRSACMDLFHRRYHADRLGSEMHALYSSLLSHGNFIPASEER